MNKINICENFKNNKIPLIFNINYEGFSKYNKNETYMQIYNKFFNSISEEGEDLYSRAPSRPAAKSSITAEGDLV